MSCSLYKIIIQGEVRIDLTSTPTQDGVAGQGMIVEGASGSLAPQGGRHFPEVVATVRFVAMGGKVIFMQPCILVYH
jgi:hypothetical protein